MVNDKGDNQTTNRVVSSPTTPRCRWVDYAGRTVSLKQVGLNQQPQGQFAWVQYKNLPVVETGYRLGPRKVTSKQK